MAAMGWSTGNVSPETNPPMRRIQTSQGDASLAGQFQTSVSGWLWEYTEVYLNNGIKYRKMTEQEKQSAEKDGEPGQEVTSIPSASKDFRSVFGDVERAVNAWTPGQKVRQNDPRQSLPLFRLMTWLDPQFVEGWTTGAMVIGMDYKAESTQKAMQFLREGLKHNPECVDIPMMFGMIEVTREKRYGTAERFLKKAISNGRPRFHSLGDNERAALQNSYRWLALVYRNTGQTEKLMQIVKEGTDKFPDDMVLPRTGRPSVVPPEDYKAPVGVRTRSQNN